MSGSDRCCNPGECVYRPALVASYLTTLRMASATGEDPTAARVLSKTAGAELGRSAGVATSLDIRYVSRLWDVERVMAQGKLTVSEVCQALCPFALDDDGIEGS